MQSSQESMTYDEKINNRNKSNSNLEMLKPDRQGP